LWAPVPWMLEAAIVLQLVLHKFAEAAIIAGLLLFNAALGFFQEGKAQATLAALKSRLALSASVCRDGAWKIIQSAELVPGDLVKLSLGAVVAADVTILDGSVLIDQSMLTGESIPVEIGCGTPTYAGALVRRGEATAKVIQTGSRTKFGHTAELTRAGVKREMEKPRVTRSAKLEERIPEQPSLSMSGTVHKIIPSQRATQPEKAQIAMDVPEKQYRFLHIENTLTYEDGDPVKLKKGAHVDVTVTARGEDRRR